MRCNERMAAKVIWHGYPKPHVTFDRWARLFSTIVRIHQPSIYFTLLARRSCLSNITDERASKTEATRDVLLTPAYCWTFSCFPLSPYSMGAGNKAAKHHSLSPKLLKPSADLRETCCFSSDHRRLMRVYIIRRWKPQSVITWCSYQIQLQEM